MSLCLNFCDVPLGLMLGGLVAPGCRRVGRFESFQPIETVLLPGLCLIVILD